MEAHHWARPRRAWIELRWDAPQRIREVQITFDSGFRRQLTLSAQESQNVNLLRAPQPETVRDYRVSVRRPDRRRSKGQLPAGQPACFRDDHRYERVLEAGFRQRLAVVNGYGDRRSLARCEKWSSVTV